MTGERQANRRIRLLLAVFAIVFGVAFGRAVWLQGVRAAPLGRMAAQQHRETVSIPAGRGTIFDDNGAQLAIGEQTTTVYADPLRSRIPGCRARGRACLPRRPNVLYRSFDRSTRFIPIARFADPKTAAQFLQKRFAGVGGYPEEKRSYPQGTVAADVIGYAGTDNKGLAGLELQYNHQLGGAAGKQVVVRDPVRSRDRRRPLDAGARGAERFHDHRQPHPGECGGGAPPDHRSLECAQRHRHRPRPRTGAILAMAQAPGYDANNASRIPQALMTNHAVSDVYEPGSVFKLVTIAGACRSGLVTPNTKFRLPSCIQVADRCIRDAERVAPSGCRWRRSSRGHRTSAPSRSRKARRARPDEVGREVRLRAG